MSIHEIMKNTLTQHKNKIQLIQWSMISGISSLLYPGYLLAMKSKLKPKKLILVPKISTVLSLLDPDGHLMQTLSNTYIDRIKDHPLIRQFKDAPELVLFNDENIEIMKTIYDLYITPNITRRIPETIAKKFALDDPSQNTFIEDKSIDYFGGRDLNDDEIKFIIDETVLQLLILMPSIKKHIEYPEQKKQMFMTDDELLIITNSNGICPIIFSNDIYKNKCIMDTLSFVTNTNISDIEWQTNSLFKNDTVVVREASTDIFNEASLVTLQGIQDITEEDNGSET